MTAQHVMVHGLVVQTEVPLAGAPCAATANPDLLVHLGERRSIPSEPPSGEILARLDEPGLQLTIARQSDRYCARFNDTCEYELSLSGREVTVHVAPDRDPAMGSLLLGGSVMAFLLLLRGVLVLHASGVVMEDRALALVGGSGMGKSTLAAQLCALGAGLLGDDLLAVEMDGRIARCAVGSPEIRLRPSARELLDALPDVTPSETCDGRWSLRFDVDPTLRPRLECVLVPRPSRGLSEVRLQRLSEREALLELSRYPRVLGGGSDLRRAAFSRLAQLLRQVPVFVAEVPWGPPFDLDVARTLVGSVRSAIAEGCHRQSLPAS